MIEKEVPDAAASFEDKSWNSSEKGSNTPHSPRHIIRNLLVDMPELSTTSNIKDIIRSYVSYSTPDKTHIFSKPVQMSPQKLQFQCTDDGNTSTTQESERVASVRREEKKPKTQSRRGLLVHAIRKTIFNSPRKKEIDEAYAFANAARNYYGTTSVDVIIDVAGGHGALAALFLMGTSAKEAVVVDPAPCSAGVQGIAQGWGHLLVDKLLRYRNEALCDCLAEEIQNLRNKYNISGERILVVACHACQFLTSDTLDIARQEGVNVCVMPCCQKDTTGGSIKAFASTLGVDVGVVIDIMTAGSMTRDYTVKLKTIDASITPQNRMIMCKVHKCPNGITTTNQRPHNDALARSRLMRAYAAAHRTTTGSIKNDGQSISELKAAGGQGRGVAGANSGVEVEAEGVAGGCYVERVQELVAREQGCDEKRYGADGEYHVRTESVQQHRQPQNESVFAVAATSPPPKGMLVEREHDWNVLSHGLSAIVGAAVMYIFMYRLNYSGSRS